MCIKSMNYNFIYVDSYLCNFVFMFILTDILLMLSLKKSNLETFWYHLQKEKRNYRENVQVKLNAKIIY